MRQSLRKSDVSWLFQNVTKDPGRGAGEETPQGYPPTMFFPLEGQGLDGNANTW